MQGFMEEQKATAGPHIGNRHTATTADGQATPTHAKHQTAKQAALPHAKQPTRQSIRQPCPTPTSHPDYKEHHVIDTTK